MKPVIVGLVAVGCLGLWTAQPVQAQGGDWDKIGLQTKKTYCEPKWSIGTTKCPNHSGNGNGSGSRTSARKKNSR